MRDPGSFISLLAPTRTEDGARDGAILEKLAAQSRDRLPLLGMGGRPMIADGAVEIKGGDAVKVAEAAAKFSGVASASVVREVGPSLVEASKAIVEAGESLVYPGERFKVEVEVEQGLGISPNDVEYSALGKLVDILSERRCKLSDRHPDKVIRAKITKSATYVSYFRYEGLGGLPVGLNGRAIVLYSGGVASYFAALETMKAGMEVTLLYLYSRGTPPAHMRRAVATATLLREHHPSKEMELAAADFDVPLSVVRGRFGVKLLGLATHRAMASAAASLAKREEADWVSSGLTVDAGLENVQMYSAEVAAKGVTAMFPTASRSSDELWRSVTDDQLKAKMPKLAWGLVPASRVGTRENGDEVTRKWASERAAEVVERSVSGAFRVKLGRGFIDYFECMDSFSSQLKKSRGAP